MPLSAGRSYQVRGLPVKRWEMGPWTGVVRANQSRPNLKTLYSATNTMIFPQGSGPMTRAGLAVMASGAVLGPVTHLGQLMFQYNTSNGTRRTLGFAGGTGYQYNWTTDAWTSVISAAALSGAGITLNAATQLYACVCGNKLIISDGINTPFMWDGTTLTKLTNAPVAYGQPVVYGAKVFFIKNTERDTIVWSEENDPTIGYEAGGYNNSWTLSQTGSENLVALGSTNEALYFFRRDSVGAIYGAVNPDFQSSSTRDSVSTVIGCGSPGGVLVYDKWVWFLDMRGRLHRFAPGGSIEPIWEQHAADMGAWEDTAGLGLSTGTVPIIESGLIPLATSIVQLVSFGLILTYNNSSADGWRAYDARTGTYQGYWLPVTGTMVMGEVYDDKNSTYTTAGLGVSATVTASNGVGYFFKEAGVSGVVTAGADAGSAYTAQIVTEPIGLNEELNWRFTRAVIRYESYFSGTATGSVTPIVPSDSTNVSTAAPIALTVTYQGRHGTATRTGTIDVGLNHFGRSLQLALTASSATGWVRWLGITVEAVPLDETVEPY